MSNQENNKKPVTVELPINDDIMKDVADDIGKQPETEESKGRPFLR